MVRVNLLTEGQSEESFVRMVLAPYLGALGVYVVARSVEVSRKRGTIRRGGLRDYGRVKRDIDRWLKQDSSAYVSTMFDVYALPSSFPGFDFVSGDPYDRVRHLEEALTADIGHHRRFVPYLQLHEFEALLFSDVAAIDAEFVTSGRKSRLSQLVAIRHEFATPEHIDDGYDTCPSRRLVTLFP